MPYSITFKIDLRKRKVYYGRNIMKKKMIEMQFGGRIVARIEENKIIQLIQYTYPNLSPDLKAWYDSCFSRSLANSFEEQWDKVTKHEFFCVANPHVKLIAVER